MNKALRSILSLSFPAMAFALTMPILSAAPAPSGLVAIMNAHSNLCLSPAGGGRDKNGEIVQFTCDQDPSRFWSFTVVSGDMLLELKQPEKALAEYEKSMKIDPNRFNGLAGAARAAEIAHQGEKANSYSSQLLKNCDGGKHSERPELRDAKGLVARNQ